MIRTAAIDDIPAIVAMGERFHAASGYDDLSPFDPLSAARTFHHLIVNPDGTILLWEENEVVSGAAAALAFPFFFNAAHKHAQEFFWWCDPLARGRAGPALIAALEDWAVRLGARSLAVASLASMRPLAVGKLYERAGYRASDATYVKGLNRCPSEPQQPY